MVEENKVIVVDLDHTLTSQKDPTYCWVGQIFDKLSKEEGAPKKIKYLSKILDPFAKTKLRHNPNRDPKGWELKVLSFLAKGTPIDATYMDTNTIPYNKNLVDGLKDFKKEGYEIVVVTASPKQVSERWLNEINQKEDTQIFDRVYGLLLDIDEKGKILGLDKSDRYTELAIEKDISFAKNYAIADLISEGKKVVASYGNSPGDIPSVSKIRAFGVDSEIDLVYHYQPYGSSECKEIVINSYR